MSSRRKRALEVLASFNPATIEAPTHFLGWPYFFALVAKDDPDGRRALGYELIKLMQCGQQMQWLVGYYGALFSEE